MNWIPVLDYEGIYVVSENGDVRREVARFGHQAGELMSIDVNKHNGYCYVCLCRDGKAKTTRLHKVVAAAFLGRCPTGKQINHIDGNKQNNAAHNLEYVTQSENMLHAYRLGLEKPRLGSDSSQSKLTASQVEQIILLEGSGTHSEIGAKFGITRKAVAAIYSGFSWSHFTGRVYANRNKQLGNPGRGRKNGNQQQSQGV